MFRYGGDLLCDGSCCATDGKGPPVADPLVTGPPAPETLTPSQRARRDRIVAVALRLLEEGEYGKVQVRDIAVESEVALGTVYRYFISKELLFAAVLVVWSESLNSKVQRRPLAGSPAEQLDDLMGRVLTAFERYPQVMRMMMVIESTTDPHARKVFDTFAADAGATFLEPLRDFDPDVALDIVRVVESTLDNVLRAWSRGRITMRTARRNVTRCIQLIFSEPPTPSA